ncbi:unnamed protein product [Symbiodinium sp. CCMP2592]|nr:unnamed protein product [Symbiodinium sp. CCMP2592]
MKASYKFFPTKGLSQLLVTPSLLSGAGLYNAKAETGKLCDDLTGRSSPYLPFHVGQSSACCIPPAKTDNSSKVRLQKAAVHRIAQAWSIKAPSFSSPAINLLHHSCSHYVARGCVAFIAGPPSEVLAAIGMPISGPRRLPALVLVLAAPCLWAERGSLDSGQSLSLDQAVANGFTYNDIVEALQELQHEKIAEETRSVSRVSQHAYDTSEPAGVVDQGQDEASTTDAETSTTTTTETIGAQSGSDAESDTSDQNGQAAQDSVKLKQRFYSHFRSKQEEDSRQFAKFPEMVEILESKANQVMTRSRRWKSLLEKINQGNRNFTNMIKKFGSAVKEDNLAKVQRVVTVLNGSESTPASSSSTSTTVTPAAQTAPSELGLDEDEDEDDEDEDTQDEEGEDEDDFAEQSDPSVANVNQAQQTAQALAPIRRVTTSSLFGETDDSEVEPSTTVMDDTTPAPGRLGIDDNTVEDDDS